jgi:hypothetical protein
MVAAAAIGGSLVSGLFGMSSASKAAKAQKKAAAAQLAEQKRQYEQTRGDLAPWRQTGGNALDRVAGSLGLNGQAGYDKALAGYTESPYLAELVKRTGASVDASRAARGGLFSGGTAQEIADRTGQLYLGDWNNYLGRLDQTSQQGLNAVNSGAQLGQQSADNISNIQGNIGNINANKYANQSNIFSNTLGQITQGLGSANFGGGQSPGELAFLKTMGA